MHDVRRKERILVATELTEASTAPIAFAKTLAKPLNADLELVHVTDMTGYEPVWEGADSRVKPHVEQLQARLRARLDRAAERLESARKDCEQAEMNATSALLEGRPWQAILEHATLHEFDMVMVGTHEAPPLDERIAAVRSRILGTTADRLVRHVSSPVWVVPPTKVVPPAKELPPHFRFLVAVDFSEASLDAVAVARSLAERVQGSLVLTHVTVAAGDESDAEDPQGWQKALQDSSHLLANQELASLQKEIGGVQTRIHVRAARKRVDQELLDAAEEEEATVLVLGSEGRSANQNHGTLGGRILGSTVERLLRTTSMPVLVVR
ncbi:MAG: universal stress protein [Myxococcota bacterium]